VKEIMTVKTTLDLIPVKHFYLFGSPITHSPSPLLHNTAFARCHFPWSYSKVDTIEIDRVAEVVKGTSFGGGSVTIPLKEQVGVLCQSLSPAAQRIGAVNTLVRRDDGTLYGDNTDWLGIHRLLHPLLTSLSPRDSAVVIGAGGTARAALYALIHLGFSGQRLLIHNPRTPSNAVELAKEFTGTAIDRLDREGLDGRGVRVLVSTLPSSVGWVVGSEGVIGAGTVVLDASYVPWDTKLIGQAEKVGGKVVRGLDMLLEQGLAQFEVWTGRKGVVVRDVVQATVREEYKKQWRGGK
jgi:pentafunctional AROM polypeptide